MARLAHVNIRTPRFEDTVAFYERVLGLTRAPAATRPDSACHAWMVEANGRASVHIQSQPTSEGERRSQSPAYHHIAFDCADAEQWRRRLTALGQAFEEVVFAEAGLLQFNLVDPSGLMLELSFQDER